MTISAESLKLFYSYSHKDEALRNELDNHLKILERQGLVSGWHDRKILPGEEWDHRISEHLETADIILLLISADFIASNYCWEVEIQRAMELHEIGKACVIPIILRSVDWSGAPFGKLQALPKNAQPLTSLSNQDEGFNFITQEIRKATKAILEKRQRQSDQWSRDTEVTDPLKQTQKLVTEKGDNLSDQSKSSSKNSHNRRRLVAIIIILVASTILTGFVSFKPFRYPQTFNVRYRNCIEVISGNNYDEWNICEEVYEMCKSDIRISDKCIEVVKNFPKMIDDIKILHKIKNG